MPEGLLETLSMPFVARALVVGTLVSLCAALLGVSLVLKRYSMIGDGLSHVGFCALAVAFALNMAPLRVAIPLVLLAAWLLLRFGGDSRIKGDAAIAVVSSGAMAVGVTLVAKTRGMNADLFNYMFGSILVMAREDLWLGAGVSAVVFVLYAVFYNKIYAVTFDERFARATGVRTGFYNTLIALLAALVIVVGMRMMGAMLISSLLVFPALSSMRVFRSFRGVVVSSALLSVACLFAGVAASCAWDTPAGASIVLANLAAFLLFAAIGAARVKILKTLG
ncbi:MAG: metal ABC transporter permease [Kiritimatiellaeota bacterium]|nr:metal ABC transporter permease [Kiritimatiellota bacterium]